MILGKYLQRLEDEGEIELKNSKVLEVSGGTGMLSVMVSKLGAEVVVVEQ